jgi:hypothetical protein
MEQDHEEIDNSIDRGMGFCWKEVDRKHEVGYKPEGREWMEFEVPIESCG